MDECRFYAPNPPNWCTADSGNGLCNGVANPNPAFCHNGVITGNNPADTSIAIGPTFVTQWMDHIASRVGDAGEGGVRLFALDNEVMLWNSTHRDVFPTPLTYDGLWSRTVALASAMKAADPQAQDPGSGDLGLVRPLHLGQRCGERAQLHHRPGPSGARRGGAGALVPAAGLRLPAAARRASDRLPRRALLPAGGVDGLDPNNPGEDAATAAKRLRSLKELYDPNWTAESWIADKVNLIPRLRQWIQESCPGIKLAVTEYSWGATTAPRAPSRRPRCWRSSAAKGVDPPPAGWRPSRTPATVDAFRLFLDYDGAGGAVDGTSVRATSNDLDDVTAYAVEDGALLRVLLFNHDLVARQANVALAGLSGQRHLYCVHRRQPAGERSARSRPTPAGFSVTLPARSANLVVLPRPLRRRLRNGQHVALVGIRGAVRGPGRRAPAGRAARLTPSAGLAS